MQPIVTYTKPQQVSVFKTDNYFHISITDDNGIEQSIKLPTSTTKVIKTIQQSPVVIEPEVVKPTIVRIDRTEDGRQIEQRIEPKITKLPREEPKKYKKQNQNLKPFTSKLTRSQVMEIKTMLYDPKFMATYPSCYQAYKEIASIYGVTYMCIQFIHKGVTWKNV